MGKTKLAPGFRFHPTDVELVRYYLKRKVMGKKFKTNSIAELEIYKFEPPDLPDKSCQRSELKWYFFCPREKKYTKGVRANRSTECGYWKTTGKDRDVSYNNNVVGKIRTLIFYFGKTHHGERTDWVMHEYRLEDEALAQKNVPQDSYVLCVLFKKNGAGPRHGDQYGAPFKEEEWTSDEEEDTDNLVANADPGSCNETSLVATASYSDAPNDCFTGVISESCVSDVPPLTTTTMLPPLTNDVVAYTPMSSSPFLEAPQAPPDNDGDVNSLLNLFVVNNDDQFISLDGFDNHNEVRHEPGLSAIEEDPVCLGDDEFNGMLDLDYELFIDVEDLLEPSTPIPTSPPAQDSSHGDSRSNSQA